MWSYVIVGWVCVVLAAGSEDSVNTLYKKVGDKVVLQPGTVPDTITSIMWKDGPNIAVQWNGMNIDLYRHFKDRSVLDTASGALTITGLARGDGVLYTPEINNILASPTHLIVISPVPTPSIIKSCDEEMTSCVFTCDGNTTGAEPVTYKWMSGGKVLPGSSKEQHITKDSASELSCELENPVSRQSSPSIPNPLFSRHLKISTGLTVCISLLAAILLVILIHRWKTGMWFFQKESMPWEADFWRKHERQPRDAAESNGSTAHQKKEQIDEETPMT